jgi:hypothetical protein
MLNPLRPFRFPAPPCTRRPEFWWTKAEYAEHGAARLMDIKEGRIKG